MDHIPFSEKLMVGIVAAGTVVASVVIRPSHGLRYCGHPRDVLQEMCPVRASHCCLSGRLVSQLGLLYSTQRIYHDDHGAYARSLEQLDYEIPRPARDGALTLDSDGSRWSVSVAQHANLAGSYLVTSEGRIHFNKSGTATTNDTVLRDLTR